MGEILANSQEGTEEVFWEGEEKNNDDSSATVKLLPRMALRVLLVEADDSTRQIISALLRKCSYRVAAVSDGLKAWETLKGRPHDVDLILTEVELPSISGFALLTLIMEHKICKNIPVIMMSSHDSISMAYKCMLRGAADFLIKPVRRNELRNLWQHTWRRQASTGGGNFTQEGSIAQRKAETTSENDATSNHSTTYEASTRKRKECSEKGSDAQSSCTRPELEAESAYIQNMQDFLPQKCAQSLLLHASKEKDYEERVKMDQKFLRHNIEAGDTGLVLQDTHACMEKMTDGEDLCTESQREDANITSVTHEDNSESLECSREAIDLIGALDSNPKYACGHRSSNYSTNKLGSSSLLELSLRRTHHSLSDNPGSYEKHILNHSNASAFSWYNNRISQPLYLTSASFCAEPKTNASNSQKHFCSQVPSYVADTSQWKCLIQTTPGSMNSVVTGESGEAETAFPCPPLGVVPVQGLRFDSLFAGHGAVFPPIFCTQSYPPPVCDLNSGSQQEPSFQFNSSHQSNLETQNSEQVHHPSDQNVNNSSNQTRQEQDHNLGSFEDSSQVSPATAQSANSSFCNSTVSHLNTSGCGSVSNGNNSSVTMAAAGRAAAESTKDESLFIQDGLKGMDSHRFTQREAALTKFRLKRKDRCYEKKVRYQSRKRLAEQRPRVKGQFVRQAQIDPIC